MNYTSAIRKYCQQRSGDIIDVSFVYRKYFPLMEYRTFLKILKRLEKEGLLQPVDKGVYFVGNINDSADSLEELVTSIMTYYTENYHGMQLHDKRCYTNRLSNGKKKHVADYLFIGAELFYDRRVRSIISALELIEHRDNSDADRIKQLLHDYHDEEAESIFRAIKYNQRTIATLNDYLSELQIAHEHVRELTQSGAKS